MYNNYSVKTRLQSIETGYMNQKKYIGFHGFKTEILAYLTKTQIQCGGLKQVRDPKSKVVSHFIFLTRAILAHKSVDPPILQSRGPDYNTC